MKRYRRRVAAKEIATFGANITGIIGALLILAEPAVRNFDIKFFAIKVFALFIVITSAVIMAQLEHKKIKKPVITDRKSPTDYSKDFAELQLKYEKIEAPKK